MKLVEISKTNDAKKKLDKSSIPDFTNLISPNLLPGVELHPELTKKPENIPDVRDDSPEDTVWVRQEFASLGIPYNGVTSFWLRPLDVDTLALVHAAQQAGKIPGQELDGLTKLLDALNPCIKDFDIRDLTVPDFYAFLYWLRINSYPSSPFTVPWTSRYGNENTTRLSYSSFTFKELDMSLEEYREWKKKGISFPTVRDMEVLSDLDISQADRWKITYAQYVYLDEPISASHMAKKVAKLKTMGADIIAQIDIFASKAEHGVVEQIKVKDANFNLDSAIAFVQTETIRLGQILDIAMESDDSETQARLVNMGAYLDERLKEYTRLKEAKDNNFVYLPEEEVVVLARASAALLFP